MAKDVKDVGASVRARLLDLARKTGQPHDLLLTRYALERLLYRLTQTEHAKRFVLKGAMLMNTWFDDPHRPTRDIDLLGFGDPRPDAMLEVFREVCSIQENDGVQFDVETLEVTANREDLAYGGLRLQTYAIISGARLRIVIDIGFGDSVEPGVEELDLPVLLDQPQPHLRAYARETVVAEKFQAMVMIGHANSRLKDYYDLWLLARSYEFDPERLAEAIAATFARRSTRLPTETPDGLKREFYEDRAKTAQWRAFIEDVAIAPGSLADVAAVLTDFLMPAARAAAAHPGGAIPVQALYTLMSPDDYPSSAFAAGEQGHVRYKLAVAPDGMVTDCTIVQSSGSTALDEATCRIMKQRAKFIPAKDANGTPVADTYDSSVSWKLN